jgi:hypothetical protein
VSYKGPKRRGRGSGHKGLRATLKYLQYREDKVHRARQPDAERWVDRGLGRHYREIFETCDELKSKHVLAWTWVLSPSPDVFTLAPEAQRRNLLADLTERVVESYYRERGYAIPAYSYVMHHTTTADGQPHLHTHVILPGTVETAAGREAFYNNAEKGHIALLDRVAVQELEAALDQTLGVDWRRQLETPPEPTPEPPATGRLLDAWFQRG